MTDPIMSAAARSSLYSLLARCLAVPDQQLHDSAGDGSLAQSFDENAQALPYSFTRKDWPAPPDFAEFQADFIAFFELGAKRPPCPLYEGAIREHQARKALMEDLLRFYHHFGLDMSLEARELPDLLSVELEFMHYLAFLEAHGLKAGAEEEAMQSLYRAQRDFLIRHLAAWTPQLAQRAQSPKAPPFHGSILQDLDRFVAADLEFLNRRATE